MKLSGAFFRSVLLAVVCATTASAAPFMGSLKHTTLQVREISPDLVIESFHPESSFETFGVEGIDHPLAARDEFDLKDATVSFIQSHLNIDPDTIQFRTGFDSEVGQHAFLRQQINGVPIANAVANIAFNKANKVVSFGSSFVTPSSVPSITPSLSLEDAISKAEGALSGKFNEHPPTLEFVAKKDGSLALTHVVQIQNDETGAWFEAFVDAHSGEVVQLTDFVAKATYRVLPITKEILTEGFENLIDPQNPAASPDGWHSDGTTTTTTTAGNNAIAFKGAQTNVTSESAPGQFIFTQNEAQAPTVQTNLDAARTNAFYIVNSVHDISYVYGFTEKTFNFQVNNFGKGGAGNDRVTISVQDSAGIDNADFATPGDGQSGRMRMFLWDHTSPMRDGALENDIVAHENTHGISNRMTGGGTGRYVPRNSIRSAQRLCLQTNEAGGMGEGWSDAMAEWTEHKSAAIVDFVLGQYVINDPAGIRSHPYSTSATTNPLRYSSLQTLREVHDIGEVWANMLHNVYAALVGVHGFSGTAHTDPTTTGGNTVFLHLFLDAFLLQPCNPTFLTARDAWIQADANRFGGANFCTLWTAFASRGLGVNAANHIDDSTVPAGC
ncbi:Fungalysin metallopeptidase-domain-containing protein [Daedaleopsis nitida]|nr:Fungalysin metallopeptidase-domain-containing protein [Daedaleopsis nitida]